VESLAIATSKAFTVPVVPRLFVDLPGDNNVRGLNAVPLWPGTCGHVGREELPARIFLATRNQIAAAPCFAPMKQSEDSDNEVDDAGFVVVADEQPADAADDDEEPIVHTGIFPWSSCELLIREYLNMWKPTMTVVTYLGNGQEVVAHVRSKVTLVAFAATAQHVTYCKDPGAGGFARFPTDRRLRLASVITSERVSRGSHAFL
jgi:hypothetical protein